MRKVFLVSHLGMGDMIVMCGAVRFLTNIYDEVLVLCKITNLKNVQTMYRDDKKIKFLEYNPAYPESEFIKKSLSIYRNNKEYTILLCGIHKLEFFGTTSLSESSIQQGFYKDIGLDISIMKDYFKVSDLVESLELFKSVPHNLNIIFVHNSASNKIIDINIPTLYDYDNIIINPNKNMYSETHPYYYLAEQFINKPLFFYNDIIRNSTEVHLIDSSFSCLAAFLLKDKNISKYIYVRDAGSRYPDLFDISWVYQ